MVEAAKSSPATAASDRESRSNESIVRETPHTNAATAAHSDDWPEAIFAKTNGEPANAHEAKAAHSGSTRRLVRASRYTPAQAANVDSQRYAFSERSPGSAAASPTFSHASGSSVG